MIDVINKKYFELFSELYQSHTFLPQKVYEQMCTVLHREYMREIELAVNDNVIDAAVYAFEQKYKLKRYVPKRLFLRWNKVAKVLLTNYEVEFLAMLEDLKKGAPMTEETTKDVILYEDETSEQEE